MEEPRSVEEKDEELAPEAEECIERRVLPDPGQPTASEVERHRCDHWPYRSWCPFCVAARAAGEQHRANRRTRGVPVFSFDYLFITKSRKILTKAELLASTDEEVMVKILAAYDTHGRAVFGHVVPVKGAGEDRYAVDRLVEDVRWLGYSRISLRSDNENAILDLLTKTLKELRIVVVGDEDVKESGVPDQILEEHSARFDSSSNGAIENGVKRLAGMIRTHKLCLEERIGRVIPPHHAIITWLVEWCAWVLTMRVVGEDGITAHRRIRGRDYGKRQGYFGEYLMYKVPDQDELKSREGSLAARWRHGLLIGYSMTSPEYWIYENGRAFLVRSVQQKPIRERWNVEKLGEMQLRRHSLHQPRARDVQLEDAPNNREKVNVKERSFRALDLRRADFDPAAGGFGYTEGCPKCTHALRYGWNTGSVNYNHDATCRARVEEALAKTPNGKRRLDEWALRRDRWLAQQIEAADMQAKGENGEDVLPAPAINDERVEFEPAEEQPRRNAAPPVTAQVDEPNREKIIERLRGTGEVLPELEAEQDVNRWRASRGLPPRDFDGDGEAQDHDDPDAPWRDVPGREQALTTPRAASERPTGASVADFSDPMEPEDLGPGGADVDMDTMVARPQAQAQAWGKVHMPSRSRPRPKAQPVSDEDVQPIMNLCASDPELCREMKRTADDVLRLVRDLGGDQVQYKRERGKMVRAMVSEMYSAPRVIAALKGLPGLHLIPGFALDLTTTDDEGQPWDFEKDEMRKKAMDLIDKEKPMFIIGSPSCTPYSSFQNINNQYRDPLVVQRERSVADKHMEFMMSVYQKQADEGRYFLHEHPAYASSWGLKSVLKIAAIGGVSTVIGDQCQYGQQTTDMAEPILKPTKWMSNSEEILKMLGRRCNGRQGWCSRPQGGKHRVCSGRHTRLAAVYPLRLCKAILYGCRNQLREDGRYVVGLIGMQPKMEDGMTDAALERRVRRLWNIEVEESVEILKAPRDATQQEVFRDDLTGQPLVPELVRAARRRELEYFAAKGVWAKRSRDEAFRITGKAPISVRWVDVDKGDDDSPNYRSRLVAREIRRRGEDPIFAPTPPLESLRTVISLAATDLVGATPHDRRPHSETRTQISFIDVSRAYFCASTDPDKLSYVELPDEDDDHRKGMVGLLLKHMYGTRAAAMGWHSEYSGTLIDSGFVPGTASACVFYHPERNLTCSVHGDDLTTTGTKRDLDWFKQQLEAKYEITEAQRLGPGPNDHKEARVLNRLVRWTDHGLEYEADPRQCEKLLRDVKLDGAKSVGSPGVKPSMEQIESDRPLPADKQSPFRAVAARANYLAADRPEIQFAAKEVCRWMSSPSELSLGALKRMGRFLEGHQRLVYSYPWQEAEGLEVYSDTDWAGCQRTRKSTSGGGLLLGRHLIKSWSSTQSSVSLSSGEAEYYGVVKASGIALGYQALLEDLGRRLPVRVWTDSTASIGICGRQGLGKLRHLDTQCLWVQQKVRTGAIELRKVRGEVNPADLFTKFLSSNERIRELLRLFGCDFVSGRSALAPTLRAGAGTQQGELLAVQEELWQADTVDWYGQRFPRADTKGLPEDLKGLDLADAYRHDVSLLPHEHTDLDKIFPKAVAAPDLEDPDPPEDTNLEDTGVRLGREVQHNLNATATQSTTTSVRAALVDGRDGHC